MHGNKGFTLITLLFLLALAVFATMVGFKIVPTYIDYFAVQKSLENVLSAPDIAQTNEALRDSFAKRLNVNFIQDISERDLQIDKEGGQIILTVPISRKTHLVGGISLCVDLEAKASAPLK